MKSQCSCYYFFKNLWKGVIPAGHLESQTVRATKTQKNILCQLPVFRVRNLGPERFRDPPTATQLGSGRIRNQTEAACLPAPSLSCLSVPLLKPVIKYHLNVPRESHAHLNQLELLFYSASLHWVCVWTQVWVSECGFGTKTLCITPLYLSLHIELPGGAVAGGLNHRPSISAVSLVYTKQPNVWHVWVKSPLIPGQSTQPSIWNSGFLDFAAWKQMLNLNLQLKRVDFVYCFVYF